MSLKKIYLAVYALCLTNYYGFKLRGVTDADTMKRQRALYAEQLLGKLNINVTVKNPEKIPEEGQYLVMSNHRGIIDPLILEMAFKNVPMFGDWISKKELYNSPFFGLFVRNAGAILLDREKAQMSGFMKDVKKNVRDGHSIFIFPEGTRNKTEAPLIEFKPGFRIIALKNKLPMLPVYIKSHTDKALSAALEKGVNVQEITIVIGDVIPYKDKEDIETRYKAMFDIE